MLLSRTCAMLLLCVSFGATLPVQAQDDPWADFRFLIGEWVSDAMPGGGTGGFTLEPDLQGKVLIRRNWADLPAAQGRPAGKHEDLMVIHRGAGGKTLKASYFDNESHVIHYAVTLLPEKKGLVFVSDPEMTAPRFRLTYTPGKEESVAIKFEFAPPGKPDEFKTYVEGTARRKKSAK